MWCKCKVKYYHKNCVCTPTRSISQGNLSQGQDDCTLKLTLHIVLAGRAVLCFLISVLMLKQCCWWLRTCPVTSTHLALPLLLTAKGWYNDPVSDRRQRVRKGMQFLITWCEYWLWEDVQGKNQPRRTEWVVVLCIHEHFSLFPGA